MPLGALQDESDLKRWAERHGFLSDQKANPRAVCGRVNTASAGTILDGSGFTITRNGTGDLTVTFSTPFSSVPVVVATSEWNETWVDAANQTVSAVRVLLADATGTAKDGIFNFIATSTS